MLPLIHWGNNAENGSLHQEGVKSRVNAITTSSPQPLIHIHHLYRSASFSPVRVITDVLTIHPFPAILTLHTCLFHHMIISCSRLQYLPHGFPIHSPHVMTLIHANYVKTLHPIIIPSSILTFHLELTIIHVVLYRPSSLYLPIIPFTIYMAQPFFQHRPILPYHPLLPINHRDLHQLNQLPHG